MKKKIASGCAGLIFAMCATAAVAQQFSQNPTKPAPPPGTVASAAPGTLTLQQVVELALEHSPQLALAHVRILVAKNTTGLERADFRPNLYTGSGAAYTNGFPETPSGAAPAVFEMSYQQDIFDPLKSGEVHADQEFAKNAQLDYENTREMVIMQAASSYLDLADVERSLELLKSASDSAERIVQLDKQRESAGLELPVAVTTDELQAAKIVAELVSYEGREQKLSEQLHTMTGIPASQPLQVSAEELPASGMSFDASNVLAETMDHSAAIREAENYQHARAELLKGAKGAYWPTVSLIGEYSVLSKINNYQDYFQHFQRNNVTAGIQVTIPIFAARTSANVALAKSNLDEATLELAQAKSSVREGAEQQVQALKEADAANTVAKLDLKLAQESMDEMQANFNQGHATLGQLEQAHVVENQKWLKFLDANLAREQAEMNLLKATGRLSQLFHR